MTRRELEAKIAEKEAELKALDREMGEMWERRVNLIRELRELRRQLEELELE